MLRTDSLTRLQGMQQQKLIPSTGFRCISSHRIGERSRDVRFRHLRHVITLVRERNHVEALLAADSAGRTTRTKYTGELFMCACARKDVRDSFNAARIGRIATGAGT